MQLGFCAWDSYPLTPSCSSSLALCRSHYPGLSALFRCPPVLKEGTHLQAAAFGNTQPHTWEPRGRAHPTSKADWCIVSVSHVDIINLTGGEFSNFDSEPCTSGSDGADAQPLGDVRDTQSSTNISHASLDSLSTTKAMQGAGNQDSSQPSTGQTRRKKKMEVEIPDNTETRAQLKSKIAGFMSNAQKVKDGSEGGRMQHSLGVDLGDVKTGLSISFGGFAPRPLAVVRQRGDKLLQHLMQVALQEKADEFIVGLPKSWDGKDTEQANKARSFAGRLANLAAQRGWRVYLQDEYGSSQDALSYMINVGSNRRSRKEQLDAYAAMALLCNYFEGGGARSEVVLPKHLDSLQLLCQGSSTAPKPGADDDYWDSDD